MGKQENQWQEKNYVLGHFGKERSKAIRAYRKFIEECIAQGRRPELTGGGLIRSMGGWSRVLALRKTGKRAEYDARVLGGEDFVAGILSEAEKGLKRQMRNRKDGDAIDGIIRKRCKETKIKEERLAGRRQASGSNEGARRNCLPPEQGAGIIAGGDCEAVGGRHLGNRNGDGEDGERKIKVIELDNVPKISSKFPRSCYFRKEALQ